MIGQRKMNGKLVLPESDTSPLSFHRLKYIIWACSSSRELRIIILLFTQKEVNQNLPVNSANDYYCNPSPSHQLKVHSLCNTKYIHSYYKWDSLKLLFSNSINLKVQHLWVMLSSLYVRIGISFSCYRDLTRQSIYSLKTHTHTHSHKCAFNIQW